jgi:hypothetical protein
MPEEKEALPGQAILMLSVALDELRLVEDEPDVAKVRIAILSVESTLKGEQSISDRRVGKRL